MKGTLSIEGDLTTLSELAAKINEWYPERLKTLVRPEGWGGWTVDAMSKLLERVHPWQLLLLSFMARAGGRRSDPEVRSKFAIGDSLRGQTGAISKHIKRMKTSGSIPDDASPVLAVDRASHTALFVMPEGLVPIVQSALALPAIELALENARKSQGLDERE